MPRSRDRCTGSEYRDGWYRTEHVNGAEDVRRALE